MKTVFLDTSFAIALSSVTDMHREHALNLADMLEKEKSKIITTRAIILEIGNALAKLRYRNAAIQLINSLEADEMVEIIPITEHLFIRGFSLYKARLDKEWSITDCITFVVMQDNNVSSALTTDEHFQQAGFTALLRTR